MFDSQNNNQTFPKWGLLYCAVNINRFQEFLYEFDFVKENPNCRIINEILPWIRIFCGSVNKKGVTERPIRPVFICSVINVDLVAWPPPPHPIPHPPLLIYKTDRPPHVYPWTRGMNVNRKLFICSLFAVHCSRRLCVNLESTRGDRITESSCKKEKN